MRKKLTTCVALAAFAAFAVLPAAASASPELTYPTGTALAVGSNVRAHSVGKLKFTDSEEMECSSASFTGTLVTNASSQFKIDIRDVKFKGEETEEQCSSGLGATKVTIPSLPWCLQSTAEQNGFEIRGGLCSEASRAITVIFDKLMFTCKYSRANVTGTFTTHPEDAKLAISEAVFTKTEGGFLCPGSGKLDLTFTLENDGLHEGSETAYIS